MADRENHSDLLKGYKSIIGKRVWLDFIGEFGIVINFSLFLQSLHILLDDGEEIIVLNDAVTVIEEIEYIDEFLKINQLNYLIDKSLDCLDRNMFMTYSDELIKLKNYIRSGGEI